MRCLIWLKLFILVCLGHYGLPGTLKCLPCQNLRPTICHLCGPFGSQKTLIMFVEMSAHFHNGMPKSKHSILRGKLCRWNSNFPFPGTFTGTLSKAVLFLYTTFYLSQCHYVLTSENNPQFPSLDYKPFGREKWKFQCVFGIVVINLGRPSWPMMTLIWGSVLCFTCFQHVVVFSYFC